MAGYLQCAWLLSHLPHEHEFLLDTGPREHGPAARHLEEDAAHTPAVDEDTRHSHNLILQPNPGTSLIPRPLSHGLGMRI